MVNSKITSLTLKSVTTSTDEFIINDVLNGNVDKKVTLAGINYNKISTKTATTYTLTNEDDVIEADATSNAQTITLPTAVGIQGKRFLIKKIDSALANLVTIATTSSQTISGLSSYILSQRGESLEVESDNANWVIIDRSSYDIHAYRQKGSTTNRWYGSPIANIASSTFTSVSGSIRAIPFIVSKLSTFDTIQAEVSTLFSGGNFRLGIYRDNGNLYPAALIFDSGSILTTTTGVKTATLSSLVLQAGLYWLVWIGDNTTAVFRAYAATGLLPMLGYISTMGSGSFGIGYSVAQTFGALPSTFPAGAAYLTATALPMILLRQSG